LLADPEIEAIYNPLPNHLHVPWSIKSLEAGKHVLCEKPIAMSYPEAQTLLDASRQNPNLKVMEAFMYRHHPQWQRAKQLVNEGKLGELRTIHSFFSYYNVDPTNVRNIADIGGGGMYAIGCYTISLSRFIFAREPERVCGIVEYDPQFKTDRLASAMLDFGNGTATFTTATQLSPYQRVNIYGTEGRVEIEIPFNAPPDRPCSLLTMSFAICPIHRQIVRGFFRGCLVRVRRRGSRGRIIRLACAHESVARTRVGHGFVQLFEFLLCGRCLFVTVVMVVIARPAADFGSFAIDQRNDRVICDPAALDAVIVNDVSESLFTHSRR